MGRIAIVLVALAVAHVPVLTQTPSGEAALAEGIAQLHTGDSFRALITLNDAVGQFLNQPDASRALARAHAYRALAYMRMDQPERANASALLALKADPDIALAGPDFTPDVVALFDAARRPATANPETTAQAAEQAGRVQEAFLGYLSAYQALPHPPPPADDLRLRQKIVTVSLKLPAQPVIPPEARTHFDRAQALLDADVALGGTSGAAAAQAAEAELRQAVRAAPWWPEAAFTLATVLQKLQRVDEALNNLSLSRRAERPAPAAAPERRKTATSVIAPATIIVYRPAVSRGSMAKPKVLCDGTAVAQLLNGSFVTMTTAPGSHIVKMNRKELPFVAESGRAYYFRVGGGALSFTVASPDEAAAEMREGKLTVNDPRRTFSTECRTPSASKTKG